MPQFFDQKIAAAYDEKNRSFAPITENLHFLLRLILKGLPKQASILCVGVGTGADILALAGAFPEWRFTGVDPSDSMLEVCRARLAEQGLSSRCELIHGYVSDIPGRSGFDSVLSLLVAHFIRGTAERQAFFRDMADRLKPGGYFVNAEISYDLSRADFPDMLEKWKAMHRLSGLTDEGAANMEKTMRDVLGVLAPEQTEGLIRQAGLPEPVEFFQSLLVRAWYARK